MYLTIKNGKIVLQVEDSDIVITSCEQLKGLLNGESCMCSSALDFPEDETDDPDVIKLADEIRNPPEQKPMTHDEMRTAIANIKYGDSPGNKIAMSHGLIKGPVVGMLSDVQELLTLGELDEAQELINLVKFAILEGENI